MLVLAPLTQLLPGSFGDHVHAYLPSEVRPPDRTGQAGDLLTPWRGYGVFALWTAALLVVAAILLKRRDA
jgi:ABC-2 type transport system permease protein